MNENLNNWIRNIVSQFVTSFYITNILFTMKVGHIIYYVFIVLLAAWCFCLRQLNKHNNERYRRPSRVLKIILNFCVVGMVVFALCHACSCVSDKKAKLDFSIESFDFGNIQKDSIYEGNVIITNSGNASLVIEKINPGCGCTTVNLSKEIILPDDTCKLTFLFDTKNRTGKQDNFITIIANTDSLVHLLQINAYVY